MTGSCGRETLVIKPCWRPFRDGQVVEGADQHGYLDHQAQGRGRQRQTVHVTEVEAKAYHMLAARLNYMGQDNIMIQFPAKEVCRSMSDPEVKDIVKIKRLARFLKGLGPALMKYKMQSEGEAKLVTVHVDSQALAGAETNP